MNELLVNIIGGVIFGVAIVLINYVFDSLGRRPISPSDASVGALKNAAAYSWGMLAFGVTAFVLGITSNDIIGYVVCFALAAMGLWQWSARNKIRIAWDEAGLVGPPIGFSREPTRMAWSDIVRLGPLEEKPSFAGDRKGRTIAWTYCGNRHQILAALRDKRPDLFPHPPK
jgi:hypothetical protein